MNIFETGIVEDKTVPLVFLKSLLTSAVVFVINASATLFNEPVAASKNFA